MLNTISNETKLNILIGLLVVAVIVLIVVITNTFQNKTISVTQPLPTPIENPIIPTSPPTPVPEPGDLFVQGIAVDNFKETSVRTTPEGNTILDETSQYNITYIEAEDKFIISILEDTSAIRTTAESRFLEMLGIDELNACRLYIEEIIEGKVYPLSPCIHETEQ